MNLILKDYIHLGVAVDTPAGLVVPVIRDVNKKSLQDIAKELDALAEKARNKALAVEDIQGATFTLSNLGGLGCIPLYANCKLTRSGYFRHRSCLD